MTAFASRLAHRLCEIEPVLNQFHAAHTRLSAQLLPDTVAASRSVEPEWDRLLAWASVLCQSDDEEHVELALAASVSALLTSSTERENARHAAAFVLESCFNTPTVRLARDRGLIDLPVTPPGVPAVLRDYRARLLHFIFDDAGATTIPVTDFQEQIWDALNANREIALSAPTSAGKSFVLIRWLAQSVMYSESGTVVAYVVPTRALIGQVRTYIARELSAYDVHPRIVTLPTLYQQDSQRKSVLVMTQERMERLLSTRPELRVQTLVVDEAQKLSDGPRGVVLQRVMDEALARSSGGCRIVLAAPHASNAEALLPTGNGRVSDDTPGIVTDSRPTVLQNLLWVAPVPRRRARWSITLVRRQTVGEIGEVSIEGSGSGKKRRLAALSHRLAGSDGGNIVFTNGPAEAEEVALLIRDRLAALAESPDPDDEVGDLAQLVQETVHPSYPLAVTLPYGVGIHYGDMPEICRAEQERLFDEGKLQYLVCTATLLEGVNLPCRNLFVWGPRQGRGHPMDEHTFWNLAGRAGRWGREFAGNIFCIDVHDKSQWPNGPPARRFAQEVAHSGKALLERLDEFQAFVDSPDPIAASRENRYFEQVLGELVSAHLQGRSIDSIGWFRWVSREQATVLNDVTSAAVAGLAGPRDDSVATTPTSRARSAGG